MQLRSSKSCSLASLSKGALSRIFFRYRATPGTAGDFVPLYVKDISFSFAEFA